MHCYFITIFSPCLCLKNAEETGSGASNQVKLFLMTLIFVLILSDTALFFFFNFSGDLQGSD